MFEWLKNLLFDEEEVVVEEDELNQINFSNVHDIETVFSEPKKEEIKKDIVIEKMPQEPQKKEEPKTVTPPKKDFNIQLKEVNKKEEVEETVIKRSERTEKKSSRREKEIEINQVLSPMFGGKQVQSVEKITMEAPAVKRKDGLGTVISPMYGQAELIVHEQEASLKYQQEKKEEIPLVEDDDWNDNVPLEELINTVEESDDCVQFSLFGDHPEEIQ